MRYYFFPTQKKIVITCKSLILRASVLLSNQYSCTCGIFLNVYAIKLKYIIDGAHGQREAWVELVAGCTSNNYVQCTKLQEAFQ